MFKTLKRQVINDDSQLTVLLEQAGVYPSVPFTGFLTATDKVRIYPFADAFGAGDIVAVRRTKVTGNSTLLTAGDYSTVATIAPVTPINANAVLQTTDVRRASQQVATLTINAVPPIGSIYRLKTLYRSTDRIRVEFNKSDKTLSTYGFTVDASLTNTTLFAQRIKGILLELYGRNGDTKNVTITGGANVLTITGFGNGIEFEIYTKDTQFVEYTPINSTFAVSDKGFTGILDYYAMRAYVQDVNGGYNLLTGETDFLPVKGAYYDSYFIKYRVNGSETTWTEHQAGTINAEQSHIVDLEIYIRQGATPVIKAALDDIGGFAP